MLQKFGIAEIAVDRLVLVEGLDRFPGIGAGRAAVAGVGLDDKCCQEYILCRIFVLRCSICSVESSTVFRILYVSTSIRDPRLLDFSGV